MLPAASQYRTQTQLETHTHIHTLYTQESSIGNINVDMCHILAIRA